MNQLTLTSGKTLCKLSKSSQKCLNKAQSISLVYKNLGWNSLDRTRRKNMYFIRKYQRCPGWKLNQEPLADQSDAVVTRPFSLLFLQLYFTDFNWYSFISSVSTDTLRVKLKTHTNNIHAQGGIRTHNVEVAGLTPQTTRLPPSATGDLPIGALPLLFIVSRSWHSNY